MCGNCVYDSLWVCDYELNYDIGGKVHWYPRTRLQIDFITIPIRNSLEVEDPDRCILSEEGQR